MADERPRAETLSSTGPAPVSPAELPVVAPECYELGPELARGGLGRLLRARDRRLGRVVALKLLRLRSAHLEARFRREARITARLQHPGIVPIHEAGVWPDGEPFYAMKLVAGESLKAVVAGRATLDERMALVPNVLAVAEAMAYAHVEGVIHRDLKPSNVMLGPFGETVVIDWGLAKELGEPEPEPEHEDEHEHEHEHEHEPEHEPVRGAAGLTVAGHVLGTAEYLPPEQARGEAVGPRADVYALGAMLYFVLAGRPPYDGADAEVVIAAARTAGLEVREPGVPPELLAIVAKAMARDAAERYPDAGAMAVDLRRFLNGKLVGAHRYSRRVLLWRWVRRHRAPLQVALAALAALAVFGVISVRRIVRARDDARTFEARAVAENLSAERRLSTLMLAQAEGVLPRDPTAAIGWLKHHVRSRAPDPAAVERVAREAAALGVARHVLTGLRLVTVSPDGATLAAIGDDHLLLIDVATLARRDLGPVAEVAHLGFSGDGGTLAMAAASGVTLWPSAGGAPQELPDTTAVTLTALDRTGRTVACRHATGVILFDREAKRRIEFDTEPLLDLELSPDGGHLLGSGFAGTWLWDLGTQARITLPDPDRDSQPVLSPRGDLVAWSSPDGTLNMHQIATGRHQKFGQGGTRINDLAFAPDGATLVSADNQGLLQEWSLRGEELTRRKAPTQLGLPSYSPDGTRLVALGADGVVRIWQRGSHFWSRLPAAPHRQGAPRWAAGGAALVTAGGDGEVRIWQVPATLAVGTSALMSPGAQLGALPGGGIALAAGDGRILLMDPASGDTTVMGLSGQVEQRLAVAPVGWRVLSSGQDGIVRSYQLDQHTSTQVALGMGRVQALIFAPDGQTFAALLADQRIAVLQASGTGQQLASTTMVTALGFSPDSKLLALATASIPVRLLDLATMQPRTLPASDGDLGVLTFTPDGQQLAGGGGDGVVRLWSLRGGGPRELRGHKGRISEIAFSPDGATMATASSDYTARLWRVDSGGALVLSHRAPVSALALSPDGLTLATGDGEGVLRLWDVGTGRLRGVWPQHEQGTFRVLFTHDGKYVVSSGLDNEVYSVPVPSSASATDGAVSLEQLSSALLDPRGELASPLPGAPGAPPR